jgi:hypothetical protein
MATIFKFLLALQLLLARPASITWILLATRNFHSQLASGHFPHCVMVSVFASSVVNLGYKHRSGQTKDYKIVICCFAKHAALRNKSKDWSARNQNNVSEWSDMSTRRLLFQWSSTIKSNSACWSRTKRTSSSSLWKLTCSRHDIAEKLLNWR